MNSVSAIEHSIVKTVSSDLRIHIFLCQFTVIVHNVHVGHDIGIYRAGQEIGFVYAVLEACMCQVCVFEVEQRTTLR